MSFQELQINRLTEKGEVQRRIRCLNGRVTVFRAHTPSEIEIYKRALTGKSSGTERFSILLDGVTLVPTEHTLLGFGEPEISGNETLAEYFINAGVNKNSLDSMLLKYGLGGMDNRKVSELSTADKTIARIISASESSAKILVLNEPFSAVPEQWREPLAERLVEFAWGKKAIVIVTALSYRPASWIDNEFVTRVQLEGVRSATIGFGSGSLSSAPMMNEIRAKLRGETLGMSSKYSAPLESGSSVEGQLEKPPPSPNLTLIKWGVFAGILAVGLAVAIPSLDEILKEPEKDRLAVNQFVYNEVAPVKNEESISKEAVPETMNLLEKYPPEISDSIAKAFENVLPPSMMDRSPMPQLEILDSLTVEKVSGSRTSGMAENYEGVANNTNETLPNGMNTSQEEMEASELARENIRQRFLEAIRRAEEDQ